MPASGNQYLERRVGKSDQLLQVHHPLVILCMARADVELRVLVAISYSTWRCEVFGLEAQVLHKKGSYARAASQVGPFHSHQAIRELHRHREKLILSTARLDSWACSLRCQQRDALHAIA